MYALRDRAAARGGMELIVHRNPEAEARGINPFDHGATLHTEMWKTEGLKQALDSTASTPPSAARGATRRRAGPRSGSSRFRSAGHRWDPKRQRPGVVAALQCAQGAGRVLRVFPLSDWTELDVWHYVEAEGIEVVPLYFAAQRPTVARDGTS